MIIKRKITVDSDRLGLVQLKLDKLNKKAIKLGIEPSHIVSQVDRVVKEKQQNDWTGQSVIVLRHVTDLEIVAHELKYGDYTYIATLDHTLGNLPVVHAVPDGVVPEMYYHAQGDCDHCKMVRQRSRTYIFKDHQGFKQVGSTCLLDFFGVDPTASLDWFGSYYGVIDEDYMSKSYQPTHSNVTVLALALAISEKSGYVSSKKAIEKDIRATKDIVKLILDPPPHVNRDYLKAIWKRSAELTTKAEELIVWGVAKFADESGDYAHNMRIFLGAEYTKEQYFGYLVSVIGAYNRDLDQLNKADVGSDNDWLGLVGDKVTINVIVNKVIVSEGNYGLSYINIMTQDMTGNNVVWFGSNKVLNDGEKVTLKGSIKALNDRDGKKQTILTRCKIV